jgi:hypothetical protein
MDTVQRTTSIFMEAEKALATLASEAVMESQYEAASCLIDSARELSNLATKVIQRLESSSRQGTPMRLSPESDDANKPTDVVGRPAGRGRSRKSSYPKFLRQGDELVKIGWSRSEKTEYEHKCPKGLLPVLAAAIAKVGANGNRFAMDRVFPLLESGDGRHIPDYQVYICMAWFREVGFVRQHGRQGYSLAAKAPIESLIDTHWQKLPTR